MLLISGIIVIILGIAALLFSVYGKRGYQAKKGRCTAVTDGTLVGFVKKETMRDDDRAGVDIFYYPVYEYYVDGKRYEIQSSYGGKINDEGLIGQKKEILYNPNNCEESVVSGEDLNRAFGIVKFFGILFFVVGVVELAVWIAIKFIM